MLSFKFGSLFVFSLQNVKTCQFIDFMLWEAGGCCKEIAPKIGGKNVRKKRTAGREKEREREREAEPVLGEKASARFSVCCHLSCAAKRDQQSSAHRSIFS